MANDPAWNIWPSTFDREKRLVLCGESESWEARGQNNALKFFFAHGRLSLCILEFGIQINRFSKIDFISRS